MNTARELFKKKKVELSARKTSNAAFVLATSMRNRMKENKIEKYVKINWKSIECDVKIKHFFSC
jgi:hypothetical protein